MKEIAFEKELTVLSKRENVDEVSMFVSSYLYEKGAEKRLISKVNLVIDEIYANISQYGYKDTLGDVVVKVGFVDDVFYLAFVDKAPMFNPLERDDPDITLSADERGIGGLGIFIVKNTMDELDYRYVNNENHLTLAKKIK
ncbi:MAG: ATP-binding protein [Bacilli bacterium]|nr:ATP-binding protein [Bacilli bacterium]